MHQFTELYREMNQRTGDSALGTRPVLVNMALVTYVRELGAMRRVYFMAGGNDADFVDVEESLSYFAAWADTPTRVVR